MCAATCTAADGDRLQLDRDNTTFRPLPCALFYPWAPSGKDSATAISGVVRYLHSMRLTNKGLAARTLFYLRVISSTSPTLSNSSLMRWATDPGFRNGRDD